MNLKQLVISATKNQERMYGYSFSALRYLSPPAQAQGMVLLTVGSWIGMGMNKVLNEWVNNRWSSGWVHFFSFKHGHCYVKDQCLRFMGMAKPFPWAEAQRRTKPSLGVSPKADNVCKCECLWAIIDQWVQHLLIAASSSWMCTARVCSLPCSQLLQRLASPSPCAVHRKHVEVLSPCCSWCRSTGMYNTSIWFQFSCTHICVPVLSSFLHHSFRFPEPSFKGCGNLPWESLPPPISAVESFRDMPTGQPNLDSTSLRFPSQVSLACAELTINQVSCYLFLIPWNFRWNDRRSDFLLKMNSWHLYQIRIAQNVVLWAIYLDKGEHIHSHSFRVYNYWP